MKRWMYKNLLDGIRNDLGNALTDDSTQAERDAYHAAHTAWAQFDATDGDTEISKVYEAVVSGASGGFGTYQIGEYFEVEGCESLEDWVAMAADNNPGITVAPASDVSGRIYGQNDAQVYRIGEVGSDSESLHCVRVD